MVQALKLKVARSFCIHLHQHFTLLAALLHCAGLRRVHRCVLRGVVHCAAVAGADSVGGGHSEEG
jgi:hypothetical protein